MTTALIADDEPLLRQRLAALLHELWPGLRIVAQARNGREAIELFDEHAPAIVFLDIHMPGLSGVEVARSIGSRARIVFVTAHEQYAVQAFEQGAVDYLVKPFDGPRLERTLARLRAQPAPPPPAERLEPLLDALAARLRQTAAAPQHLQWIKASVGASMRLIPVDEVVYLRSDEKYTLVVWQGGEALIRKTIRELADELDPARFVQIHRSVIVAVPHVSHVVRSSNETAEVHLRGRSEVLPVSRSWLHVFRQM
jgi:DNA-binding LytR/AlgR family response regulator